jgi:hypothetical protein
MLTINYVSCPSDITRELKDSDIYTNQVNNNNNKVDNGEKRDKNTLTGRENLQKGDRLYQSSVRRLTMILNRNNSVRGARTSGTEIITERKSSF